MDYVHFGNNNPKEMNTLGFWNSLDSPQITEIIFPEGITTSAQMQLSLFTLSKHQGNPQKLTADFVRSNNTILQSLLVEELGISDNSFLDEYSIIGLQMPFSINE